MSRQHFKIGKGTSHTPVSARPSDPENGDVIYNGTSQSFERYENGAWVAMRTVSFAATKAGGVSNGAAGINSFDTLEHDTHSAFNTSTGIYTVPVAGNYVFKFNTVYSTPQTIAWTIVKNDGTTEQYGGNVAASPGANYHEKIAYFFNLQPGDLIKAISSSGSSVGLSGTHFCGYKVG